MTRSDTRDDATRRGDRNRGDHRCRVLHVITMLELGGAQQNTLHTVRHLDRERYDVALAVGPGGMLDDEARSIPNLTLNFVESLVREIAPARDVRAVAALVSLIREFRPDIVHTHSSKAGILGRLAAFLGGVPCVVHSVHGFGFTPAQRAPVRSAFVAVERLVAPLTTHFVAVSRANITEGVRRGLFARDDVTLIRSGFPLGEFLEAPRHRAAVRRELAIGDDELLVGGIACLKPQKDPLTFAAVAARVLDRVPRARFVLAGDGEMRGALEQRLSALGVADRVHLLGWRDDVPRLMHAMDVLLHTARWEGLPRVLPQAMAAGLPVVATAVDGAPEAIEDGVTGLLSAPRDVAGLAEGVIRLLDAAELRCRLGSAGRARVAEFSDERLVPAQQRLYDRLSSGEALTGAYPEHV